MENSSELSDETKEMLDNALSVYREAVISYNITRLRWELYNILSDEVRDEIQYEMMYGGGGVYSDFDFGDSNDAESNEMDEAEAGKKEEEAEEDQEMMDVTEFELMKRHYAKIMRDHLEDFDEHYHLPDDVWSIRELLWPDNLRLAVPDGTNPVPNIDGKTQADWIALAEQKVRNEAVESERATVVLPAEYRYLMTLTDGFVGPDLPYQWHQNILECFSGPRFDRALPVEELLSFFELDSQEADWTVYAGLLTGRGSLCTAACGLLLCEKPGRDKAWRIFYLPEDGEYTDLVVYDDFEKFLNWYGMYLPRVVWLPTLEEEDMNTVMFRRRFSRVSMRNTP
ncbi:hypothetical protein MBLNU457_7375t1 [Dothideomycetes sp. NU457]